MSFESFINFNIHVQHVNAFDSHHQQTEEKIYTDLFVRDAGH